MDRETSRKQTETWALPLSYFQLSIDTKQILKIEILAINNISNQVCLYTGVSAFGVKITSVN